MPRPAAPENNTLAMGVCFIVSTIVQGCSQTGVPSEGDEVSRSKSALYSTDLSRIFDTNSINVCFQPRDSIDIAHSSWTSFTTQIQTEIEGAFEVAGDGVGLNLSGWGLCQNWSQYEVGNESATTIQIMVDIYGTGAATRFCPPNTPAINAVYCSGGEGSRVVLLLGPHFWALVTGILHEFAHGLGFTHEFLRPDRDGACQPGESTVSGLFITDYDPDSILNGTYCGTPTSLSALDQLGLEIAYPASTTHALHVTNSMTLANGTLLARSDSTITDEWTARGAHNAAVFGGAWTADGSNLNDPEDEIVSFSGSDFTSTPQHIIKTFVTFVGDTHTAEAELLTSDGLHAALLVSTL